MTMSYTEMVDAIEALEENVERLNTVVMVQQVFMLNPKFTREQLLTELEQKPGLKTFNNSQAVELYFAMQEAHHGR